MRFNETIRPTNRHHPHRASCVVHCACMNICYISAECSCEVFWIAAGVGTEGLLELAPDALTLDPRLLLQCSMPKPDAVAASAQNPQVRVGSCSVGTKRHHVIPGPLRTCTSSGFATG